MVSPGPERLGKQGSGLPNGRECPGKYPRSAVEQTGGGGEDITSPPMIDKSRDIVSSDVYKALLRRRCRRSKVKTKGCIQAECVLVFVGRMKERKKERSKGAFSKSVLHHIANKISINSATPHHLRRVVDTNPDMSSPFVLWVME